MMKATKKDKAAAVALLSSCFDGNASVDGIVGSGGDREMRIRRLMAYCFDSCMESGAVYFSPDYRCVALVMFPDRKRLGLRSFVRDLGLVFHVTGLSGLFRVISRQRQVRKRIFFDHVFYLWFIASSPETQGGGRGTGMMECLLDEARRMSRPVFLETSSGRSRDWYLRLGFELYDELWLGYRLFFFRKFF